MGGCVQSSNPRNTLVPDRMVGYTCVSTDEQGIDLQ